MDFVEQEKYEGKIGNVIECMKSIEVLLNEIILNRIQPMDLEFSKNIVLNSGVISFGNKVKLVKTICNKQSKQIDCDRLHRLINIRNLFAHETSYVEDKGMIVKMNELKSDGKYNSVEFEKLFDKFIVTNNEAMQELTMLHNELKSPASTNDAQR